jgi:hypothetical protein
VIATTTFEDPKIADMRKVAVQISCLSVLHSSSNQDERPAGLAVVRAPLAATPPPTADKEVSLQLTEGIVTGLLAKICCTCSRLDVCRFSAAGMMAYPQAAAAGGRKAPRHEIA